MTNPLKVTDLPRDVLLLVFQFLGVKDIARLRMTCHLLDDFSRERLVWINATKTFCHENRFPLCSFSTYDTSANTLERTLSNPYSVGVKLASPGTYQFRETVARFASVEDKEEDYIKVLKVLPGGRFILTASSSGAVVCWDAGPVGVGSNAGTLSPKEMASINLNHSVDYLDVANRPDLNSFSIVATQSHHAFELDDEDPDDSFSYLTLSIAEWGKGILRKCATVSLPSPWRWMSASGTSRAFAVARDSEVIIYHVDNKSYSIINLLPLGAKQILGAYFAHLGFVLVVGTNEEIGFYFISSLASHTELDIARENASFPPSLSFNLRSPPGIRGQSSMGSEANILVQPPYVTAEASGVLSFVWQLEGEDATAAHAHVVSMAPIGVHQNIYPIIPLPLVLPPVPHLQVDETTFDLLDDAMVITRLEGYEIVTYASTLGGNSKRPISDRKVVGWRPQADDEVDVIVAANLWRNEIYVCNRTSFTFGEVRVYYQVDSF